jgi:hypothetical protein
MGEEGGLKQRPTESVSSCFWVLMCISFILYNVLCYGLRIGLDVRRDRFREGIWEFYVVFTGIAGDVQFGNKRLKPELTIVTFRTLLLLFLLSFDNILCLT